MELPKPLCIPEIRKLSIAAETMSNKFLKEIDLTSSQSIAMFLLLQNRAEEKEPMTQRDLEQFMAMSNPAVAGVINRLEAKGFVRRVKKGNDMRYNYLEPTEKGIALQEVFYPNLLKNEDKIFAGFTEEERDLFYQFVSRMLKNVSGEI